MTLGQLKRLLLVVERNRVAVSFTLVQHVKDVLPLLVILARVVVGLRLPAVLSMAVADVHLLEHLGNSVVEFPDIITAGRNSAAKEARIARTL